MWAYAGCASHVRSGPMGSFRGYRKQARFRWSFCTNHEIRSLAISLFRSSRIPLTKDGAMVSGCHSTTQHAFKHRTEPLLAPSLEPAADTRCLLYNVRKPLLCAKNHKSKHNQPSGEFGPRRRSAIMQQSIVQAHFHGVDSTRS